jgi:hypothetical protein
MTKATKWEGTVIAGDCVRLKVPSYIGCHEQSRGNYEEGILNGACHGSRAISAKITKLRRDFGQTREISAIHGRYIALGNGLMIC